MENVVLLASMDSSESTSLINNKNALVMTIIGIQVAMCLLPESSSNIQWAKLFLFGCRQNKSSVGYNYFPKRRAGKTVDQIIAAHLNNKFMQLFS